MDFLQSILLFLGTFIAGTAFGVLVAGLVLTAKHSDAGEASVHE